MKKVIIVGFLWPYIGGSKRVIGLARYLKRFGWEPIILSPLAEKIPPADLRVAQTDYRGFLGRGASAFGVSDKSDLGDQLKQKVDRWSPEGKRILRWGYTLLKEIIAFPDEHKGWQSPAVTTGAELIEKEVIDAVLSVWPVTSHLVAKELKQRYHLPWIADLADLWSDNSAYPYGRIRQWFDKRLELDTLKDADLVTTSSSPLAERMSQLHDGRQIHAIMMGFDPQTVRQGSEQVKKPFTITYTGMFYPQKRDPLMFFKALHEAIAEGRIDDHDLSVRLYGPRQDWVARQIEEFDLSSVVLMCGQVPYEECLERQRESHVLLQMNWSDVNEKGVFSGKLLDYLATMRPILAAGGTGNDEVVIKILNETQSGVYAVTPDEIKGAIESYYQEYKQTGTVGYKGNPRSIDQYSVTSMCRKYARLLDEISVINKHASMKK